MKQRELKAVVVGGVNRAIKTVVAVMGAVFGIGGMGHGFFEALQGNKPTGGLFIEAIGPAHRFWEHGREPAFTIIPNFLVTGIAAIAVGIVVLVWSLGFMHRKQAPAVFLGLFILLLLVGGGVAQVIFFTILWAFSTRIHAPLSWWKKKLPPSVRPGLARRWAYWLAASAALIIFTLQVAIFGWAPGVTDPDALSLIMVATLGTGLLFLVLAFISACAADIIHGENPA
ncbi:MAG: hypothetical protein A2087_02985 [Spirochaetes bacterium GWD1_61_31]|nr:MAG: hypothetical protein A2Y37_14080 [Spirochaetes bacterium GWB1_60_80]OHD34730.1 MAG: hypothetical protein A2004_00175 [Spirochaetes bacterium GWC1_61_12]OHD38734.1 MAG: hypothetical protein A2087_02985 [Spirochaetes bacterium GWD1_61_31]OHD44479.1 MAG: hypothetical protein A2Y35_04920 [Spirochaetes bacterium GWE1_60_18]OHD59371.1 MAG: hypothetical protein A2Y32_08575 [Spirochaetes bacterium GWF1_60_12]HAP43129.1 hypothetical protein [Spirochaetaceae bacterium]